jgi:phospholipid-transporting ATPase
MSLPSSFPKNWPNSTQEELALTPQRIVTVGGTQLFAFCDNSIKTAKYELWNFFPKFLLEEFNPRTKFANCYFFVIACLQIVPQITNTNQYPTVLIPLFGILLISGVLKALEDRERHKADRLANSSDTEIFDRSTHQFVAAKWSDITVGDFIRVKSRTIVPADIIVFQTWEPNPEVPKGACYVETKSLDGETNLKYRSVLQAVLGKIDSNEKLAAFKGSLKAEHPNSLIDNFTGVLESNDFGKIPILPSNVILRGCVLRSTEFVIGFVVNTGHDVKIMQSKLSTKAKSSNLERIATKRLIEVILFLLFLCLSISFAQYGFNKYYDINTFWYLQWDQSPGKTFIIKFFYTLLLHASFVPVSLYVSMALVRFGQSHFMNLDLDMYYAEKDIPALVRTMSLNEELGQISHIFSDKTGTLTNNDMKFRKASINGKSYGKGITEIGKASWRLQGKPIPSEMLEAEDLASKNTIPHVSFYCPDFDKDFNDQIAAYDDSRRLQREKIRDFYRYLSVCHEIIPERLENGQIKLSANSPDDEALVCAAAFFGYEFKDRRDRFAIIFDQEAAQLMEIEVLYTIPFSSTRKRMSVIIRDMDHKIKIITKGADTVILARSDPNDVTIIKETVDHIQQFSLEGLRCLMVAVAIIDEENFKGWSKHYDEANTDLSELEKKKKGEVNDIETLEDLIERGLHVIGATGIEDRLQEGVPECIETLMQAGMKVWILTGDKEETAINIGVACNLLEPQEYMDYIILNRVVAPDARKAAYILRKELAVRLSIH